MNEEELRKCSICHAIIEHCHQHNEKQFCITLLSDLKENKISNEDFIKELSKKVDFDSMIDSIVPHKEHDNETR